MTNSRRIAAGALVAGMTLAAPAAFALPGRTTAADGFSVLDAGEGTVHEDAHGSARIVRDRVEGTTTVTVVLNGLVADREYPAHLHVGTCDQDPGPDQLGDHYQHDPDGGATASNELWPEVVADARGRVRSHTTVSWVAGPEARAVVVHDVATHDKVLCADL